MIAIKTRPVGYTKDHALIQAYSIENGNVCCQLSDYGATLLNLFVPDRYGHLDDVVLGYDDITGYFHNPSNFGATIGPSANRTAKGQVPIDGKLFRMPQNEGENNLHTDLTCGLHKVLWDALIHKTGITFKKELSDGMYGLPGNRKIQVDYTLTEDNTLRITYDAKTDQDTLFNLTNHSYFNLAGEGNGTVLDHTLRLGSSAFTPIGDGLLPTGEIRRVSGTPMDFTDFHTFGERIFDAEEQLTKAGGYDHNFVIDGFSDTQTLAFAAEVKEVHSGRHMCVYTTLPGVQLYTGNYVDEPCGKRGHSYDKYSGFCLETQFYPDNVHHAAFPSAIFSKEHPYQSVTEFRFG